MAITAHESSIRRRRRTRFVPDRPSPWGTHATALAIAVFVLGAIFGAWMAFGRPLG